MWGHMAGQGMGMGQGCGMGIVLLVWLLGIIVWSIIFTVLVLQKLDKIIHLLDKK